MAQLKLFPGADSRTLQARWQEIGAVALKRSRHAPTPTQEGAKQAPASGRQAGPRLPEPDTAA